MGCGGMSKTSDELRLRDFGSDFLDAQIVCQRCALCDWTVTGAFGEVKELARRHRVEFHSMTHKKRLREANQCRRFGCTRRGTVEIRHDDWLCDEHAEDRAENIRTRTERIVASNLEFNRKRRAEALEDLTDDDERANLSDD